MQKDTDNINKIIEKYNKNKIESINMIDKIYWDYIIITVNNKKQKKFAEQELKKRKNFNISNKTKIIVKIASQKLETGGMLLKTLKSIRKIDGCKKILYIPSAGKAQRTLYYFNKGKIWIPVNRRLDNGEIATIFDEILINTYPILKNMTGGLLISCSDVILLMGQEIDILDNRKTYTFTIKENLEKGIHHGVFKIEDENIIRAFQKANRDILEREAITKDNKIYIDTGLIILPINFIQDIPKNKIKNKKLDIYADLIPSLIENNTKKIIPIKIDIGKFIHFGSSKDILEIKIDKENIYKKLKWNQNILCKIEENGYLENSECLGNLNCSMLFDTKIEGQIPPKTIMYTAKINKKKWVTIFYGIEDDIKGKGEKATLFNKKIKDICAQNEKKEKDLWNIRIYLPATTELEASKNALKIYKEMQTGKIVRKKRMMNIKEILEKEKIK